MFTDDCSWDTPECVKALNETIFQLHQESRTKKKKKSHIRSDIKLRKLTTDVCNTKADSHEKTLKTPANSVVGQAVVVADRCNRPKSKAHENDCSVQKKKRKNKCSVSSDKHGGKYCALALDDCSPSAVIKPDIKLKPAAKCVKAAKKRLKPEPDYISSSSNLTSLSVSSSGAVSEALSQDCSVLSKRRKRKRHNAEVDSTAKLKKNQTVGSKADEVHVVTDERFGVPNKCNFNVVQLRSALQQYGKFSDTASKQDILYDEASLRDGTLKLHKESTCTSTQLENIDKNMSRISCSSTSADTVSTESSSGSLRERMMNKLVSARFRFINEQMYRSRGSEAADMFAHDKDAFAVYHAGFQSQVSKWPTNPVDRMIDYINSSGPLAVVVDFGCGDAKIARSVPNVVHSFDLVALNEHVTACDMAHVPLKKASVDIAVFCLSLMGTNIVQYLAEASRVLKLGGVLLIAEVVSRFEKIGSFVRKLRKLGFELENKAVNKMFVWFEMKKVCVLPREDSLPSIDLYPCLYKKR